MPSATRKITVEEYETAKAFMETKGHKLIKKGVYPSQQDIIHIYESQQAIVRFPRGR